MNCRSLVSNFEVLKPLVKKFNPKIISVCEIWGATASSSILENYQTPIFKNRLKRNGGGCGLYFRKDVKISKMNPKVNDLKLKIFEIIAAAVILDNKETIVASVYRSPNSSIPDSLNDLNRILESLTNSGKRFILSGDLNIDLNNPSSLSNQYLDLLQNYHCTQMVTEATRVTSTTQSLIDHFIVNFKGVKIEVSDDQVADHRSVIGVWKFKAKSKPKPKVNFEDNIKDKMIIDYENSIKFVNEYDWNQWLEKTSGLSVHEHYLKFQSTMSSLITYKKKSKKKNKLEQPWFTCDLLQQRNKQLSLRKKFIKSHKIEDEKSYNDAHKKYKKDLNSAKTEYFSQKLEKAQTSSKELWRVINECLSRNKFHEVKTEKLIYNDETYEQDENISNAFNSFYKNQAYSLTKNMHSEFNFKYFLEKTPKCEQKMSFEPTTTLKTYQIIQALKPKTSFGFDELSNKLIKKCALKLSEPITSLINKSFNENEFPEGLKINVLKPLYKADDKSLPSNWRPISMLSTVSKIIESTANKQIVKHFQTNELDSDWQFGFKAGHSCVHPLMLTRHHIEMAKNEKLFTILISIDLKSCFDLIESTNILPVKLEHFGLEKGTSNWMTSFFSNRKQMVKYGESTSKMIKMNDIGVVQGSCLGPNSFNVFINDIDNVSEFKSIKFADDTNFLLSDISLENLMQRANTELKKVIDYFESNKLLVSKHKCSYMIIKPKPRMEIGETELFMGNEKMKKVDTLKFLGIEIDESLKFDKQIEKVKSKLRSGIGALIRVKHSLNYRSKYLIYMGLIKSHLDYCFVAWGDKISIGQMKELSILQKRAVRLLFSAKYNAHTAPLFSLSGITPVDEMFKKESLIFLSKYLSDNQPKAFQSIIGDLREPSKFRDSMKKTFKISSKFKKGNLLYEMLSQWNTCEQKFRDTKTTKEMKKLIKDHLIEKNKHFKCPNKKNCYTCQR